MTGPLSVPYFASYGSMLPYGGCAPPRHIIDELLNREYYATPQHLRRALYLPHHSDKTVHLPVYNVTSTYRTALQDTSLGSTEYKTRLCMMQKPTWSSVQAEVDYLVNINTLSGCATIDERCLGVGQEVEMLLPATVDEGITMKPTAPTRGTNYKITVSYPIAPDVSQGKPLPHPYFEISAPGQSGAPILEWQVYPEDQGRLCYMLVDKRRQGEKDGKEDCIRAIYHHAGLEAVLPTMYSEGILLLPEDKDPRLDTLITSSVVGLLWTIRSEGRRLQSKSSKRSFFGLRKKSR